MVKIRLSRIGAKKHAVYRIIVADIRSPRDGRCVEELGVYDPHAEPRVIQMKQERYEYWIKVGARPTTTVKNLMAQRPAQP